MHNVVLFVLTICAENSLFIVVVSTTSIMKHCIHVIAILCFCTVFVSGQYFEHNERKWYEYNGTLYQLELESWYKWEDAFKQCRMDGLNLIRAQPEYHPDALKMFLQEKIHYYPSMWIQNNATQPSISQKSGFKNSKDTKLCNKMDNRTFAPQTTACDDRLGFLCEKTLINEHGTYQINDTEYYIEPKSKYSCSEAKAQCLQRNMSMILRQPYKNNTKLQEFVFLHYGTGPSFWFKTDNISDTCIALDFQRRSGDSVNHGFICEKQIVRSKLTLRHWVLIGSVSFSVFIAIIAVIVYKVCMTRNTA
ncbi:uncharacterized protein [Musca autumnalis]|uniref:uncharacterized protein n=1 Tax=Musca autumnalis TaxID=221902 RepID=UPI003CF5D9E4